MGSDSNLRTKRLISKFVAAVQSSWVWSSLSSRIGYSAIRHEFDNASKTIGSNSIISRLPWLQCSSSKLVPFLIPSKCIQVPELDHVNSLGSASLSLIRDPDRGGCAEPRCGSRWTYRSNVRPVTTITCLAQPIPKAMLVFPEDTWNTSVML